MSINHQINQIGLVAKSNYHLIQRELLKNKKELS